MWRTGGRVFAQLLQKRVVASPPLRVPVPSPLQFHEAGVDERRRAREEREAAFVERVCKVVKRREWGSGTASELASLRIRLRSKVVNRVLRGLDDAEAAHRFFLWACRQPSFRPSLHAYHAIIEVLGAAHQFDAQSHLLQEMHCQGLQPTTSTFNILLLGFARANDTERVVATFTGMVERGWSPNAFTFKCVIRSLIWSGRTSEALSTYTKMVQFGFIPDNFTYTGLIEGLCKAGLVDEACGVFREMEERGLCPDPIAHAAVIKGLDMKGRVGEAWRVFRDMTGKNLPSVVETRRGVMGVFSKRHKQDLSARA